jgi:hypothetical protein
LAIERLHDADARHHGRAAEHRDQDQGLYGGMPFRGLVNVCRKLGNVIADVAKGAELAAARDSVLNLSQALLQALKLRTDVGVHGVL